MKAWIIPLLFLGGCAGLATRLPDIDRSELLIEQTRQEHDAFAEMARLRDRLAKISSKVLISNADLCERTGPDIGVVTHTLKNYPKRLRAAAKRELGAGNDPVVLYVRPDSPADKLGISAGDTLFSSGDKVLGAPSSQLSSTVKEGRPVTVKNNNAALEAVIPVIERCDYPVKLKMTTTINAYATGRSIIVTSGMMNFVASDDELAAIIGHELAHNEMSHIRKIMTNLALSGFATRYTRDFESEADYVGLYYSARAGFEIENVEDMWRRLAKLTVRPIVRPKTHPTFPDRYVRIAATRKEIELKRAQGQELVPNFKDTDTDL